MRMRCVSSSYANVIPAVNDFSQIRSKYCNTGE